ncbi:hypothetical protein [Azotobacter chroococcum]|uniref:hypothetical protein n=2 Tax=Azotobacter chroococcum TaxID=353 RepID=UPI001F608511|nr:hypothetical protein [Azotobacter chroococcum]
MVEKTKTIEWEITMTTKMMRAARMYECGKPMVIEEMPVPTLRPIKVLVKVEACGIVPTAASPELQIEKEQ